MNIKRLIGLDIAADDYRYTIDPDIGFVSAKKAPDRWVTTTCGYCSVGCGMLIGVKDGRAVSVRGNPDHPVNRGHAVPEGPVGAPHDWRRQPRAVPDAAREKRGPRERTTWDEALSVMADAVP